MSLATIQMMIDERRKAEPPTFEPFQKIPRLRRNIQITEKIDGTNAQVYVRDDGKVYAGSRNRWVTPEQDNYGFAKWVYENADGLAHELGPGRHYGEWWGQGIQRKYGMDRKVFSLFNWGRWQDEPLELCSVVPLLYSGDWDPSAIEEAQRSLQFGGSRAAPGFMEPEGIVIFHHHSRHLYKVTLDGDGHKGT